MSKTEIQTDLIGGQVIVTIKYPLADVIAFREGILPEDSMQRNWVEEGRTPWNRFGQVGVVRAAYLDRDRECKGLIEFEDGALEEHYMSHTAVWKNDRPVKSTKLQLQRSASPYT